MPRIQQNSMPTSLHYALTDSQCGVCGGQLEWKANFNDINQPKYTAQHCNQDYSIHIDAVKVEVVTRKVGTEATRRIRDELRAIKMAKGPAEEEKKTKQN